MLAWFSKLADKARHRARMRLWAPAQASGRLGEDLAHRFLQRVGYSVVARNFRNHSASGEVDLIAWDGDTLVFAEVKSLASDMHSAPDRAIDRTKQDRLIRAAAEYVRRSGAPWEKIRFDTINVLLTDPPQLSLRRDAFRPHAALRGAS